MDIGRLHETVPRTVATPVDEVTEPNLSTWTRMSSGVRTVTLNVADAVFPLLSVAVQVTVVSPIGKVPPEAGAQAIWGLGSALSVAETSNRLDGLGHVEVVDHRPGTGWVVPRLVELAAKWQPCAIVVDEVGPAGSLIAPLEAAELEVLKPSTRARAAADSGFYDAVTDSRLLRYVPRPALDAKRPLGDSWGWARRGLSVDISPLVAASLARWGHATRAHLHNREPSIYL